MTIQKQQKLPEPTIRLVNQDGTLSKPFYDYLRDLDLKLRQVIDVVNDHETRITALEP
jgi:hypothetical protein